MSQSKQSSLFGQDQEVAPPDTQLAAGPGQLLEAVNSTLSVWTKDGAFIGALDLNQFFQVPAGFSFGDPWLIYDALSGRFFLSGFAFDPASGNSQLLLGVTASSDPTGQWATYFSPVDGFITDQPKIGASNSLLVQSWNYFQASSAFPFVGSGTFVLQKSDLLAFSSTIGATFLGPDTTRFGLVPVQSLGATDTQYVLYHNPRSSLLGLMAVSGTPAMGNVVVNEADLPVPATTIPPQAEQPFGRVVDTGDDRLLSAVWQNGTLWTTGNDGCVPVGDTVRRSCVSLVQLSTLAAPAVVQAGDLAAAGVYLSYPAVMIDGKGNLAVMFSASSSIGFPGVVTTELAGGSTSFDPAVVLKEGDGPYAAADPRTGRIRWGDYSGASRDPLDPSLIWVAGEYAATGADPGNWGTEIGEAGATAPPDTVAPIIKGVRDAPDPFSPNGDGHKDRTKISWRVSEGCVLTFRITKKGGAVVQDLPGYITKGRWFFRWNGRDRGGRLVRSGVYRYLLQCEDAAGNQSQRFIGTTTVQR